MCKMNGQRKEGPRLGIVSSLLRLQVPPFFHTITSYYTRRVVLIREHDLQGVWSKISHDLKRRIMGYGTCVIGRLFIPKSNVECLVE